MQLLWTTAIKAHPIPVYSASHRKQCRIPSSPGVRCTDFYRKMRWFFMLHTYWTRVLCFKVLHFKKIRPPLCCQFLFRYEILYVSERKILSHNQACQAWDIVTREVCPEHHLCSHCSHISYDVFHWNVPVVWKWKKVLNLLYKVIKPQY